MADLLMAISVRWVDEEGNDDAVTKRNANTEVLIALVAAL
jgi:hypothetical protein